MKRISDATIHRHETERHRCLRSLWYLCTEVLGYDKLSETFHKPMLAEWDRIDHQRFGYDKKTGHIDLSARKSIDTIDLWPRDHIKTWCERARVIRYYMFDPCHTHTWWHSVELMAQESVVAVGKTLQTNLALRKLFPQGVLPAMNRVKFVTGDGFRLSSNPYGHAPSLRAWGAGSEATGGHSIGGTLDDPIGLNDVVDSQMPAKTRWYQATVCNVVRSEGFKDVIGTRWDRDDIYAPWLASPHWVSTVRACLETDGKPDYKGQPVYLTMAQVEKKRAEMGEAMFAFQMQNDPSPTSEKPWDPAKCEHYISMKEYRTVPRGARFVLGDPAPARVGSLDLTGARSRGDGTKDEWAWQVVEIRQNKQRQEIVWLDGSASRDWTLDDGFEVGFLLAKKWGTPFVTWEAVGQAIALYEPDARRAARKLGAAYAPVALKATYKGKNAQFGALCSRAAQDEFLILDTIDEDFRAQTLDQCRNWRPLESGRNALKYDDRANALSFACDPGLQAFSPQAMQHEDPIEMWEEEFNRSRAGRSRYCGV